MSAKYPGWPDDISGGRTRDTEPVDDLHTTSWDGGADPARIACNEVAWSSIDEPAATYDPVGVSHQLQAQDNFDDTPGQKKTPGFHAPRYRLTTSGRALRAPFS